MGKVALAAKAQVVVGIVHGQREDMLEVSALIVAASMVFGVKVVMRQRLERHMGWFSDHC